MIEVQDEFACTWSIPSETTNFELKHWFPAIFPQDQCCTDSGDRASLLLFNSPLGPAAAG